MIYITYKKIAKALCDKLKIITIIKDRWLPVVIMGWVYLLYYM